MDPRGPDGTTIIAPFEQARPEDYPGVIPEKPLKKIQLFDVRNDIIESNDLSENMPDKVQELLGDYQAWYDTLPERGKN